MGKYLMDHKGMLLLAELFAGAIGALLGFLVAKLTGLTKRV